MGKFDESIAQYRKALSIDPNFIASHSGISADLMYQNKPAEAAAEIQQISNKARSDAEARTALFNQTVSMWITDSGTNWRKWTSNMRWERKPTTFRR